MCLHFSEPDDPQDWSANGKNLWDSVTRSLYSLTSTDREQARRLGGGVLSSACNDGGRGLRSSSRRSICAHQTLAPVSPCRIPSRAPPLSFSRKALTDPKHAHGFDIIQHFQQPPCKNRRKPHGAKAGKMRTRKPCTCKSSDALTASQPTCRIQTLRGTRRW